MVICGTSFLPKMEKTDKTKLARLARPSQQTKAASIALCALLTCTLRIILLLAGLLGAVSARRCSTGVWQDSEVAEPSYSIHFATANSSDPELWRRQACANQYTGQSCFWKGDRQRAERLLRRRWRPDSADCLEFWPHAWLELMRNKRVLFVGDSLMMQVAHSLVCSLDLTTKTIFNPRWEFAKWMSRKICPWEHDHCNSKGGNYFFPLANSTISVVFAGRYTQINFFGTLSKYMITKDDLVVISFGAHYRDKESFVEDITNMRKEIVDSGRRDVPHILYTQALPQHFNSINGYYDPSIVSNVCTQFANISQVYEHDWRNRLVEDILEQQSKIILVRHVSELYSQWDAHVELMPNGGFDFADCSHWCFPGEVFRYIHRILFNSIIEFNIGNYKNHSGTPLGDLIVNSYNQPPQFTSIREGMLVKSPRGREVYLIQNGTRREFSSGEAFMKMGFSFESVVVVDDFDLADFKIGPPIS